MLSVAVLAVLLAGISATAAVPTVLHYQGVLTDGVGTPITTNTSVTFTLWSAPIGGMVKWSETRNVTPDSEGRFAILLGQAVPLHDSVFKMPPLYLGTQVEADPELTPRSLLASNAFAFRISTIDGATGGNIIGGSEILSGGTGDGLGVRDPGGNVSTMSSTSNVFTDTNNDTIAQFGDIGLRFIEPSTNDTIFYYDPNTSSLEIGVDNAVIGLQSFAIGTGNSVSGNNAFAIGTTNQATQANGFALGTNSVASGANSLAAGTGNSASATNAAVVAGSGNQASGLGSFVGGGTTNDAFGQYGAVSGGQSNQAGTYGFVGGGGANEANADWSAVLGGFWNITQGANAVICGGNQNRGDGIYSMIGGGVGNRTEGRSSVVPGGEQNAARGPFSSASGYRGKANHAGTFVWADSTIADFASTGINQFLIRAAGGVGIGTAAPGQELQIGDVNVANSEGMIRFASRSGIASAARTWDIGVPETDETTTGKGYDFVIDDLGTGTDPEAVFQFGNGYLGLGVLDPSNRITLPNHANTSGQGLANAWTIYSSRRWKKNIRTIDQPLELVTKLRGVRYDWMDSGKPDIGLIAEEVGAVIPEVVQYEENGVDAQSVDYARLVALLIEGMKEQQKRIEALESRLERSSN